MNRFLRQMKKSHARRFSSILLPCNFMRLAATSVRPQWKMLRMIEEKTGQSAIVCGLRRRKPAPPGNRLESRIMLPEPRPEGVVADPFSNLSVLKMAHSRTCGFSRAFGENPQVPAKGAWPCATRRPATRPDLR